MGIDERENKLRRAQTYTGVLAGMLPGPGPDTHLRLAGWNIALTVTSQSLTELAAFAAMPRPGDQQLKVVCAIFDRIVARAAVTLHAIDPDLLMWLLSPKNEAPKQQPFVLPQDKETLPRYVGTWKRFLCYLFRTMPASLDEATATGVQSTLAQHQCLLWLQIHLDTVDAAQLILQEDFLEKLVALATMCLQQRLQQSRPFVSPLMPFFRCHGHRRAREQVAAAEDLHSSPGRKCSHLQTVRTAWLTEASGSPTSKILRQLAYGKAIIKHEGSAAVVTWSEDNQTLWFNGRPIALQALRDCIHATIAETDGFLTALLFDDRPTIDFAAIQDSLSREGHGNAAGYSFVTAAANRLNHGFTYLLNRNATMDPSRQLLRPDANGEGHKDSLKAETVKIAMLIVASVMIEGTPNRRIGQPDRIQVWVDYLVHFRPELGDTPNVSFNNEVSQLRNESLRDQNAAESTVTDGKSFNKKDIICFKCGEQGHFKQGCRSKKSDQTSDGNREDGTANAVMDKVLATGSGRKKVEK
ncbi:MAG: hypothetical protein M1826_004601 [Phylliscum demangeonii]|nr:MAG: hypothetical protein M1826_004601 [Phylliscum demangeonii]